MQESDTVAIAEPVTDQRFDENSDDAPEIGGEAAVDVSSETDADSSAAMSKRGRGRPPKPKTDDAGEKSKRFRYFPVPIRKVVGNTQEFKHSEFIRYWKKVAADPELRDRAVCYVYRTYPVVEVNPPGDVLDADTAAASKKTKYLDCTVQPFENDEDVWARYGSGDYKFFLNDSGFPGRAKTQMTCYFTGTREWDKYPPMIDPKTVVIADPKNGSYVRYLQSKGLMPKTGNEGDDEDMAGEALREMAGTVKELTDKVIDMAHRPVAAQPTPIQPPSSRDRDASAAVDAAVSSLSKANDAGLTMMKSAFDTVAQIQAKAGDPIETLNKLVTTVRSIFPQQDTTGLERMLMESQRKTEALEAKLDQITENIKDQRIKDLEAKLEHQAQQQQGQPPKDALTQAREFAQLQREMRDIFGSGSAAAASDDDDEKPLRESREPWFAKYLPQFAGIAGLLVTGAMNIMHNQAVARTGQGNPAPPPPPPPEVQQMAGMIGAPMPPLPGAPPDQSMDPQQAQIRMFIKMIETSLKFHLDEGLTGHDFADWLLNKYGNTGYEQVIGAGADNIISAIQQHAPEVFARMQQDPQRAQEFINQFMQGPQEETKQEGVN